MMDSHYINKFQETIMYNIVNQHRFSATCGNKLILLFLYLRRKYYFNYRYVCWLKIRCNNPKYRFEKLGIFSNVKDLLYPVGGCIIYLNI